MTVHFTDTGCPNKNERGAKSLVDHIRFGNLMVDCPTCLVTLDKMIENGQVEIVPCRDVHTHDLDSNDVAVIWKDQDWALTDPRRYPARNIKV